MEASCDDRDIAVDLVQLFFELTGQEMVGLKEAADTGNTESVVSISHKCAGSSSSCGLLALANMLRTIELDAKQNGLPDDLQDRLKKIDEEMNAAKAGLEAHFNCVFTL